MIKNAAQADDIVLDQTTMYVVNNFAKLEYGSVITMNLFPSIKNHDSNESATEN